jgi:hypothetical protein
MSDANSRCGLSRIVQAWLRVIDSVPTFYCEHARPCGRYCDGNGSLPDCNEPVTSSVQRGRARGMLHHLKGTSCIFGNQLRVMSRLAALSRSPQHLAPSLTAQSPAPGLEKTPRPLAPFAASRIFDRSTHRARRGQIGLREPFAGREGKLCSAVRPEPASQRSAEARGCAASRITFPNLANPPGGGQRLVGLQSAIGVLAKRRRRGATVTQAGLPRAATCRREAGANWRPFASCKAEYRTRATMEHSCTGYLGSELAGESSSQRRI